MPSTEEVVKVIKRSETEELRIGVSTYNGKRFINLRVWWHSGDGNWKPGKGGLALKDGEYEDVILALSLSATILKEENK